MDASSNTDRIQLRVDPAAGVLSLHFKGPVNADDLEIAHERLVDVATKTQVGAILIDARFSEPAYTPAELIDNVERSLQFVAPRRCAFVASEDRKREVMLIETVSFPFSVRVRAFTTLEDARAWASEV
ncbi:MAG: STAS/SEC14 domain-containing protein [Oceanicaulis sp.]